MTQDKTTINKLVASNIMDNFMTAVGTGVNATQLEDAVDAWRAAASNNEEYDHDLVETVADAMTDAIRQIGERQEQRCAIRITNPLGTRLTFSWLADGDKPSPTYNQAVLGAVKRALDNGMGK